MKVDELSRSVIKNALEYYIQRLEGLPNEEGFKNIPQSICNDIEVEKGSAQKSLTMVNNPQIKELDIDGEVIIRHGKVMCNALTVYQGDLQVMMDKISKELHGARPKYELVYNEIEKIPSLIKTLCPK